MELLCRTYWYPLYAYVRRQGHNSHDAQDLTQEFFSRLLEKGYLHAAAAEKGRFRTFLLVALQRFLANEWDRGAALKRGGGRTHVPLDAAEAESRYQTEPADSLTPERIFERRWAVTVLEQTLVRLRAEYERLQRLPEFERLKGFLTAERGTIPYGEVAAELGVTPARLGPPSIDCASGFASCSASKSRRPFPTRMTWRTSCAMWWQR